MWLVMKFSFEAKDFAPIGFSWLLHKNVEADAILVNHEGSLSSFTDEGQEEVVKSHRKSELVLAF